MSEIPSSPPAPGAPERRRDGFKPRVWIVIVVLVPLTCYAVYLAEMVFFAADLVSSSLMVAAVFVLSLLLLLNALLSLRRQQLLVAIGLGISLLLVATQLAPPSVPLWLTLIAGGAIALYFWKAWRRAETKRAWEPFTRRELLIIYVAITVSTWFSSMGGTQFLVAAMASPFFFADNSNGWSDLAPLIPRWISVRKPAAINPFFHGQADWTRLVFLKAWAIPVLSWSLFVLALFGLMLGINTLLRKQWIEHERLTFPIAQFPLQITAGEGAASSWRSPLFWLGAALAFGVEAVNGLHQAFPTIPVIPILPTDLSGYFTQKPWSGMGSVTMAFYPWILGLVYLVPLDVSFSSWFFYVFSRLEAVAGVALGVRAATAGDLDAPPYQMDQGMGAFLALGLLALWTARRHLVNQFQSARLGSSVEGREARTAFAAVIFCGLGLLVWFRLIAQNWLVMAGWLAVYILMLIAISRMRAEAGPGWVIAPRWPQDLYWFSVGGSALTHEEMTAITYHTWLIQDVRHTPMATQMEGFKIADGAAIPFGRLVLAMVVAMLAGLLGSWWAAISVTYRYGYATANMHQWRLQQGRDIFGWLQGWISGGATQPNRGVVIAWVIGFLALVFLSRMRSMFLWWPFHPVGYAIANTFSMAWLWGPTLISWMVKALILRYGGSAAYRRGIPFAVGLILGDFFISGLFAVASVILHVPMYKTFPVT